MDGCPVRDPAPLTYWQDSLDGRTDFSEDWEQFLKPTFSNSLRPSASVPTCCLPPLKTLNAGAALTPPPAAGLLVSKTVGSVAGKSLFNHRQAVLCVGFRKEAQRNAPSRLGPSCSHHATGSEKGWGTSNKIRGLWSWCSFPAAFSLQEEVGNSPALGISFG
ncbi:uncharacterized protein ACIBXB_016878 isoform 1-T1 [Morphnus guianensis]